MAESDLHWDAFGSCAESSLITALHAVVNRFGHAVVLLDDAGVVVQANEAAARLVGRTAASLRGGTLCPFLDEMMAPLSRRDFSTRS